MEIVYFYDSALRSFSQTSGDCQFWHIDLARPPWVMKSRCIFEEYDVYTVEKEIGILRHITS